MQHKSKKANAEIEAAVSETSIGASNKHSMSSCREASSKMEDLLFSVGGVERIVATLRYFRGQRTVKELDKALDTIDRKIASTNRSKEGQLHSMVMERLRNLLGMFGSSRGRGSGRRSLENQNVFDAIMTAINIKELTSANLGRMLSCSLNVYWHQIKRG